MSAKLLVECPSCEARYHVDAGLEGKKIRCRQCQEAFIVEDTDGDDEEAAPRKGIPVWGWAAIGGSVVAGLGLLAFIGSKLPDEPVKQPPALVAHAGKPQAPAVEPEISEKLTSAELFGDYEANQVAGDQRYKGQWLLITGQIQKIGTELTGKPFVVLSSGEEVELFGVQCVFSRNDADALAELHKGQSVQIKGQCRGKRIGHVIVERCQLVAKE